MYTENIYEQKKHSHSTGDNQNIWDAETTFNVTEGAHLTSADITRGRRYMSLVLAGPLSWSDKYTNLMHQHEAPVFNSYALQLIPCPTHPLTMNCLCFHLVSFLIQKPSMSSSQPSVCLACDPSVVLYEVWQ